MTREEAFKLKVIPTAEKLRLLWERIHELEEKIEALEAERPKGHWIGEGDGYADGYIVYDTWYCSECDHCEEGEELALPNFCPDCGADMRPKLVGKHADVTIIDEVCMKGADDE